MLKLNIVVFSLISLISVCLGQVVQIGQCEDLNIPLQENFDIHRYEGRWYEIEAYPDSQTGTCNMAYYTVYSQGFVIIETSRVLNNFLDYSAVSGTVTSNGLITMTIPVGDGATINRPYMVLATDYETYSLVYSCHNPTETTRAIYSWKLGRRKTLPEAAVSAINDVINSVSVLSQEHYVTRSHAPEDCVFQMRGLCDRSISGVTSFRVDDFLGEWIEVARYPQVHQTGQCARAEYTALESGAIHVLNSEVINQARFTQEGEATIASTDGTGHLNVVFEVNDQTRRAEYIIIETDYANYALLYSCANLPNGNRQVSSWILSRSTELDWHAQNAIIAAIILNPDLNQYSFETTSQDNAACFYYPVYEELPGFIELRGACPYNIRGVPNFNVNEYLGRWREIERYPQIHQTGQCSRARYTALESGAVRVENTEVRYQALATQLGEATLSSNDGYGELDVVFVVNGQSTRSNYYVLATDYKNYALVYSCANLTNGNRQVGSWKLSRTTTLSEDANNATNAMIEDTEGLKQDYYQVTSQSADSCFYYTEQTGDHIILSGQCDSEIPTETSFDVARFSGIWYHLQRYDDVGVRSCISSRLSFDEGSGDITVNFVEVIGGEAWTAVGVGRLTSDAGIGNFSLIMWGDHPEESEVRIIGTDYDEFAIAYTCKNIDEDYRQVGVWQLGRHRTMTMAGAAFMELLISQRNEFIAEYLKPIPQRETCPDPSSAFLVKSSIIVILVCSVLQMVGEIINRF